MNTNPHNHSHSGPTTSGWVRTSRRVALASAALVLGLSACGEQDSKVTAAQPPVIKIGQSQSAAGESSAGASAGFDDRMMLPMAVDYVYSGEYPTLAGQAGGWQFAAGFEPTLEQMRQVAAAFGIAGDPVAVPAEQGGGWRVGPEDYSAPTINFSADAMGSWWYSPGPYTGTDWSCPAYEGEVAPAVEALPTEETVPGQDVPAQTLPIDAELPVETFVPCEAPTPPAGVPTAAEAETLAAALFAQLGVPAESLEFETYADDYSANVTAWVLIDGVRSQVGMSVGFGGDATLTWSNGYLAKPVRVGDYPLIGCEAGVQRLNDEADRWPSAASPLARADDAATTVSEAAPAGNGASGEGAAIDIAVAPPEDGSGEVPTELTITFNNCRVGSTMIWAADNSVWLVPAYEYEAVDGGIYSVIAIDDSFIELPDYDAVPLPEPGTEPMIEPAPVTVQPVDPASTAVPADPAAILDEAAALLVGVTAERAEEIAAEQGWTIRIVEQDGESFAVTMDFRQDRVNVVVADGVITAVANIG
jgi:hypothetical protein